MAEVFTDAYAKAYDLLYQEKDYADEVSTITHWVERFGLTSPASILDIGCGTGNHSLLLAERGNTMTGVDLSQSMLQLGRKKASEKGLSIETHVADMAHFKIDKTFDVAVCMFAALCYQTTNKSLSDTLKTIASHLKQGGVFMFDFWYGPAVLATRPEKRERQIKHGKEVLNRVACPNLSIERHVNEIDYALSYFDGENRFECVEKHSVRFFFPQEIIYFLQVAGFTDIELRSFPNTSVAATEDNWNAFIACRKGKV